MKVYDEEKYYRMICNKQMILTHQLKRLSKAAKRSNFYLIYYSTALIVYTLTLKYFPNLMHQEVTEFSNVIVSIILLIYSIINSNSRYFERVHDVESALQSIKELKRRLGSLKNSPKVPTSDSEEFREYDKEWKKIKRDYEVIVRNVEYRDDLDFYHTVRYLSKQFGIKVKKGKLIEKNFRGEMLSLNLDNKVRNVYKDEVISYIDEIDPTTQKINKIVLWIWHFALYIAPIILFGVCVAAKYFLD